MDSSKESISSIQKNLRKRRLVEIRVQANSLLEPLRPNLTQETLTHLWIALTCDYAAIILPQASKVLARMVADLVDAELLSETTENGLAPNPTERESPIKKSNFGDFEII